MSEISNSGNCANKFYIHARDSVIGKLISFEADAGQKIGPGLRHEAKKASKPNINISRCDAHFREEAVGSLCAIRTGLRRGRMVMKATPVAVRVLAGEGADAASATSSSSYQRHRMPGQGSIITSS
eukprot:scaffold158328_cov34-Prasinocladus_malaysianus.AAC.1